MDAYEAPPPDVADAIYRNRAESDKQYERLEKASPVELKEVLRNTGESNIARGNALMFLMASRDPELPDLVLELFDDQDQDLWRMLAPSYRFDDPRHRARLQQKLDDDDDRNWSEAAVALALAGEESLFPRLTTWLDEGDEGHRNVAIECLKRLKTSTARRVLEGFWDEGKGDYETRSVIAAALLDLGDQRGCQHLDALARGAEGSWSVFAATSIYIAKPRDGLAHMLRILDTGDLDAKQSMVNQIWNFAHLPHAFTNDGLDEARVWVQTKLDGDCVNFGP